MAEPTAADRATGIERCAICAKDWRMPFTHRECVEALQARVAALEAERAQACARVVELELHLDRYTDPKQWDIWP